MLKKVRKKVASSVSKIEYTDYYEYSKWLREPSVSELSFGILEYLDKINQIKIEAIELPIAHKLKFILPLPKFFPVREKMVLRKPKAALVFFAFGKPQPISFNENLLYAEEETVKKNFFIDIITVITPYNFSIPFQTVNQFYFSINTPESSSVDLLVETPVIEDKLSEIIPEVYKIELLDSFKMSAESLVDFTHFITDIKDLPVPDVRKFLIPGIDDLSSHVISYKPDRFHLPSITDIELTQDSKTTVSKSPKLEFRKTTTKVLKFVKSSTASTKISNPLDSKSSSAGERKLLKHILTGSVKATWEKTRKVIPDMLPYQEEGAKYLAENPFTVMAQEPGGDKQIQIVGALKFLHKTSQVKSSLIIIKETRLGKVNLPQRSKFQEGLIGRLIELAPELQFNIVSLTQPEVDKSIPVIIVSYKNNEDLKTLLDTVSANNSFDLVIVDEFTESFSSEDDVQQLFHKFYPDYLWMVTGIVYSGNYKSNFEDSYLPEEKSWKFLIRKPEDLKEYLPSVRFENVWFKPDQLQIDEYNQLIDSSSEELRQVIQSLNPFKFQSTVFSLIHKIKQISNFPALAADSPKSRFLLDQIRITSANKRRTLLFTQYDNHGLKKLEKLFEENKIRYLSVQNGSSSEDLKRALDIFYTRDDYPIFMTNLKPARIKANLNKISYVISFDQWWNPALQWQAEDDIGLGTHKGQPVVYYNFLLSDFFDEMVIDLIESKSMNNKEIYGELNSESLAELVDEYDWQNIFDLKMNIPDKSQNIEFIRNNLSKINTDDFSDLLKRLFMRLGYRDVDVIELQDEPAFYILGRSGKLRSTIEFRAKCVLAKNVAQSNWEEILDQEPNKAKFERLFVISTGIIQRPALKLPRKVNFIDGEKLINLINILNLMSKETIKLRKFDEDS